MSSPAGRVFSSWEEIAAFLGQQVSTVQRWEKTLGLPIQRPEGNDSDSVVANETDLRKWLHQVEERSEKQKTGTEASRIRKIADKLDAVEEEQERLHQMLSKMETRFDQIEHALRPQFKGNGQSGRAKQSPSKSQRNRKDGGDSSSGTT